MVSQWVSQEPLLCKDGKPGKPILGGVIQFLQRNFLSEPVPV
ncbi:hypothetical protein [Ancylothrix sp. D3o]|nr:hypothetical protein [Ancylothrix sp. D3o]